jgi:hypothetical protein
MNHEASPISCGSASATSHPVSHKVMCHGHRSFGRSPADSVMSTFSTLNRHFVAVRQLGVKNETDCARHAKTLKGSGVCREPNKSSIKPEFQKQDLCKGPETTRSLAIAPVCRLR